MRDRELSDRYMEVNQDEEIYNKAGRISYSVFGEEVPGKEPPGDRVYSGGYSGRSIYTVPWEDALGDMGLTENQLLWLDIREKGVRFNNQPREFFPQDVVKGRYDFVRNSLEKHFNKYGGYAYRVFHNPGQYYSGLNMFVPNGFKINEQETERAWRGLELSHGQFTRGTIENVHWSLGESVGTHTSIWRGGKRKQSNQYWTKTSRRVKWNKDYFYQKYVLLEAQWYDYTNQWYEDVLGALIGDLQVLQFKFNLRSTGRGSQVIDFYENPVSSSPPMSYDVMFNIGWFIGEIMMVLDWAKTMASTFVYPIFVNFPWQQTAPEELLDSNWNSVINYMDALYKIDDRVLSSYREYAQFDPGFLTTKPPTVSGGQGRKKGKNLYEDMEEL